MAVFPLILHRRADQPVAYRDGAVIDTARFIADVSALAQTLPEHRYVLNLCGDRYRFAVGLAAALVRGQINLLPPNHTPALVADLKMDYPGLYGLTDSELAELDLAQHRFPILPGSTHSDFVVPSVPAEQVVAHVFTSGSTGRPLPQIKTWGGLARGAVAQAERLAIAPQSAVTLVGILDFPEQRRVTSTPAVSTRGVSEAAEIDRQSRCCSSRSASARASS